MVVLGDTLLDTDVEGTAERLCPDAPVPVVDVQRCRYRPGGAGLAAALAARSGADVVLVTALGDDEHAQRLAGLLGRSVSLVDLPLQGGTVCKTRVRVAGQSLLRLDSGEGRAVPAGHAQRAVEAVHESAAVLVADYGRGVAAHRELRTALAEIADRVPVVWDPHPRGAAPVPGSALVTPNEKEAALFAAHPAADPGVAADHLRERWTVQGVAVTRGSRGAWLSTAAESIGVPVPAGIAPSGRIDSCGAGDAFATAAVTALMDGGGGLRDVVAAAVRTATEFVAAGAAGALAEPAAPPRAAPPVAAATGYAAVDRVRRAGGTVVATGGCFDLLHPGHVSLLRRARALGDALVVCVNSDESVRRLKGPGRPVMTAADRVGMLEALEMVDAVVVFSESSPVAVLERLRPDIWVKGEDYAGRELPEAEVVRRHGGRVVLVPLVERHSTTGLITALRAGRSDARSGVA
nr:PfkB family carbohydrate kinase [Pseudonocardia acidicola]